MIRAGWCDEGPVDTPIAIDLLGGSRELRLGLESRVRPRELVTGWTEGRRAWEERREAVLLYR